MRRDNIKKILFLLLLTAFLANLANQIYQNIDAYTKPFDEEHYKKRYENSQWAHNPDCIRDDPHVNPETCIWDDSWYAENTEEAEKTYQEQQNRAIGDDELYTYAASVYIKGGDPTLLNAEIPPLGKYAIGASIILFNNQNIFALTSGIFALLAFYALNMKIFKDREMAFVPVFLLSLEPLFYTQLATTHLDLFYLALLLTSMYFFLDKKYILSSITLGAMMATKSPMTTFLLVAVSQFIFLAAQNTKDFKNLAKYTASLTFALATFTLSYIQFFILGNSFIDFLRVQKWIIDFYAQGVRSYFDIWEMLLTGSWNTWWGTQMNIEEWNIFWVLAPIFIALYWIQLRKQDIKNTLTLVAIWATIYIVFLTFIPSWPRYLLLLFPFTYNLAVWLLTKYMHRILLRVLH